MFLNRSLFKQRPSTLPVLPRAKFDVRPARKKVRRSLPLRADKGVKAKEELSLDRTSSNLFNTRPPPIAFSTHTTMATALRLGSSALRSSLTAPAFNARTAAFNGLRCYSSSKTQVRKLPQSQPWLKLTIATDPEGTICRTTAREY